MPRAILVLTVLLLAAPAAASAATTRYASPTGGGDCSTAAKACSLETAFDASGDGDTVIVGPGPTTARRRS